MLFDFDLWTCWVFLTVGIHQKQYIEGRFLFSIFQAALISNGTCKYSTASHHFCVRARRLLLHGCDFLGRESKSYMITGIVFSLSLFVVFPGKEGYLKVPTWDLFLLCVTQQNMVIWAYKKPHTGSDLCFEGAWFLEACDHNVKVKEVWKEMSQNLARLQGPKNNSQGLDI